MKQLSLPYQFVDPPKAVRKARLGNIALVPASMLPLKGTYQPLANNLPRGGVLICEGTQQERVRAILQKVASFFRGHGHHVVTLPKRRILSSAVSRPVF